MPFASIDRNSSRGDLDAFLRRASLLEARGEDGIERAILDVFAEINRRATHEAAYPFRVDSFALYLEDNWEEKSSYVFCLCLSYLGWKHQTDDKIYPRRIFELLCTNAAAAYVNGKGLRFGTPRTPPVPGKFREAVDHLCRAISEGQGFSGRRIFSAADGGLDLVAWRDQLDGLPGKLIMFGACATGSDWKDKFKDLDPDIFCKDWMKEVPVTQILKAFFVPHRVAADYWGHVVRRAGMLFERCRICVLEPKLPNGERFGDGLAWVRATMETLQGA